MMDGIGNGFQADLLLKQMSGGLGRTQGRGGGEADASNGPGGTLSSFGDLLNKQIAQVSAMQSQSAQAMETYASGGDIQIHQVMNAASKASLAMELTLQMRNKLLSAYQEISHMSF
jgi:flagellar hook-basal body complex protein FliE